MTSVTLSPKYQIVIPKIVREELNLDAGMKMSVIVFKDRIELIPISAIKLLRGSLKGIDTKIIREKDRL